MTDGIKAPMTSEELHKRMEELKVLGKQAAALKDRQRHLESVELSFEFSKAIVHAFRLGLTADEVRSAVDLSLKDLVAGIEAVEAEAAASAAAAAPTP